MAHCLTTQAEILVWMRKGIKDVMARHRTETAQADGLIIIMVEFPGLMGIRYCGQVLEWKSGNE
ncbi:hypothetical protein NEUTE1DRAFT_117257 [Neurospora tetrasperma FGSC 2508]|uniref:Uncharacterized protein n=1 Tax=Neurospora tetrasperma (strain FGSC 2508 / ATCC MYA-4615 / P0657) TaxID=510951 RepID=F8MPC1_NEUT8|nr:uncharacterized protein NEUTE1DRAFT_117257 [Neurospora tetrasperma FGSC 2508]EGO56286.1 hypothetical protein NEUTE1DRAFT_117257 [Neurospora tetrasperma FGSC 2508]EGZ70861.1 hypothetical protein NEUTE2DRAFT_145218 [Neurospora tetrasperma FGSC 2509]